MSQINSLTSAATALIITCEHGGNQVPAPYHHLFRDCGPLLESHRGFDPGALVMARALAGNFGAPLLSSTISRLVVDLNRSIGHRNLHMEAIRKLSAATRQKIIELYYQPYRTEAERLVARGIARCGRVIHISCHSFTNNLNGVVRDADIGLLYDPSRPGESALCANWKSALKASAPDLVVRRNFPYKGRDDGLTPALRRKFPSDAYLGIELELNQKNLLPPARQWKTLRESIITSLDTALGGCSMTVQPAKQHGAGLAL
ncbi:Predicted N-formylglutamate amidohydrolase [Geoalkalibacter ferrihydriticus]|uniref:Predicted N-formylglutamate amidohydrolase n=1 Tax=Geoalkalibacter ferrihydriticus TaxID=392333 RepID=A0A1G9MLU0_9BACT|nr:N-formylglutamate amidohydrolase [Geoalkalibacter ferrihydriticus]SDL74991.1 Predicted N-formylglutamate amidohydrolase [Geoalkalibacter ferrihydriticus]